MARRRRAPMRMLAVELARVHPELTDIDALVASGRVLVDGRPILNARSWVRANARITVLPAECLRGTAKLEAALRAFAIDVRGRVALDLGASAGGFTAALLDAGAARVYAVDAGFGQLRGWLRQDSRVVNLERVNLGELGPSLVPEPVSLVTADLSYLPLADALPQITGTIVADGAELVALVKPMFELKLARPPSDEATLARAVEHAAAGAAAAGWRMLATTSSPEPGRRGAIEFFLYARRREGSGGEPSAHAETLTP
jgi:23S rRNA (cytidine1920-2'-O)/16S rRNA (cytidine1409-2'-O)-methyltransferase